MQQLHCNYLSSDNNYILCKLFLVLKKIPLLSLDLQKVVLLLCMEDGISGQEIALSMQLLQFDQIGDSVFSEAFLGVYYLGYRTSFVSGLSTLLQHSPNFRSDGLERESSKMLSMGSFSYLLSGEMQNVQEAGFKGLKHGRI